MARQATLLTYPPGGTAMKPLQGLLAAHLLAAQKKPADPIQRGAGVDAFFPEKPRHPVWEPLLRDRAALFHLGRFCTCRVVLKEWALETLS